MIYLFTSRTSHRLVDVEQDRYCYCRHIVLIRYIKDSGTDDCFQSTVVVFGRATHQHFIFTRLTMPC
jgi:hypothetical protein